MRNIFLIFLLANLALLAWQAWVLPPEVADPYALPGGQPATGLVLLKPAVKPGLDQVPAAVAQATAPPGAARCARIGPYEQTDGAGRAAARLRARGLSVRLQAREGEVWVGHWVQITGLPGRGEAEQALTRLAAVGLGDAYIVRSGQSYKLSLGVFRSQEGIDQTVERARRAGFEPVVEDRFRQEPEYWLYVRYTGPEQPELAELARDGARILRVEAIACNAPEAAVGTLDDGEPETDSLQ